MRIKLIQGLTQELSASDFGISRVGWFDQVVDVASKS